MTFSNATMASSDSETMSLPDDTSIEAVLALIPNGLHDVSLQCLSADTLGILKLYLDINSDVQCEELGYYKDFTGLAQWAKLDDKFIRYINSIGHQNKVSEVISMWIKENKEDCKPTVANLLHCLWDLERRDVIKELTDPPKRMYIVSP